MWRSQFLHPRIGREIEADKNFIPRTFNLGGDSLKPVARAYGFVHNGIEFPVIAALLDYGAMRIFQVLSQSSHFLNRSYRVLDRPGQRKYAILVSDPDLDVRHKRTEYFTAGSPQLRNGRLNPRIPVNLAFECLQRLVEGGVLLQAFLRCPFHILQQRSHVFFVDHCSLIVLCSLPRPAFFTPSSRSFGSHLCTGSASSPEALRRSFSQNEKMLRNIPALQESVQPPCQTLLLMGNFGRLVITNGSALSETNVPAKRSQSPTPDPTGLLACPENRF